VINYGKLQHSARYTYTRARYLYYYTTEDLLKTSNSLTDPLLHEFLSTSAWLNLEDACFNFIFLWIIQRTANNA